MTLFNLLLKFDSDIKITIIERFKGNTTFKTFENKAAIEKTYNTHNWLVTLVSIANGHFLISIE